MEFIIILTAVILGTMAMILLPFLPSLLVRYFASKERITTEALLLASSIPIPLLYVLFVSAPYHFQGYQDIEGQAYGMEPWGLPSLWLVNDFVTIAVSWGVGLWWLSVSLFLAIFGNFRDKKISVGVKTTVVLIIIFCMYNMQRYEETIGMVLE